MDEDFRVPSKSNADCESFAASWRQALVGSAERFDVFAAIEKAGREFRTSYGLTLVAKPDVAMGQREAYAQWVDGTPRIFAKESIIDLARANDPWGVATLVHELMHIVFEHRRQDDSAAMLPRLVTTNVRPSYIEPHESAEHQTRVATAEFLMPRSAVERMRSVEEIQKRFGVSLRAAQIRYSEVIEARTPRDLPEFGKKFLEERRSATPKERLERPAYAAPTRLTEADRLWEAAPVAPGQPPAEYRISRKGFPVRRRDHLKSTEFGWYIHNGEILAHRESAAATQAESEICPDCGNLSSERTGLNQVCRTCGARHML